MLIDPHVHSSGISPCSRVTPEDIAKVALRDRLGAVVLTNHYKTAYRKEPFALWRHSYAEEYRAAARAGEKLGVRVFFGAEVTLNDLPCADLLIYGITPEEVEDGEDLCALSLPALSALCRDRGWLLYQAHPFRPNAVPADPSYLFGVEINCHPNHAPNSKAEVFAFAAEHHLALTCGSDYHGDSYKPHCGILIPDSIATAADFACFLRAHPRPPLCIHDTNVKLKK